MPNTVLPDGTTVNFTGTTITDPLGTSAIVTVTGITGQVTANTAAGTTAISGDLSAKWKDAATTTNAAHSSGATGNESITDSAKPALLTVTRTASGGRNLLTFAYSEALTVTGVAASSSAASTSTLGDMTTAGTIAGTGSFATAGSLTVPASKNTVSLSADSKTITITLDNQTSGYIQSGSTESQVAGEFTAAAAVVITDASAALNQVNTSSNPTETYTTSWDYTRPTITSAVIQDNYQNSSLTAGRTFTTGSDGQADTIVFTTNEALITNSDSSTNRGEWSLTGASGQYGTSLTPVYAASSTSGTTTLVFAGLISITIWGR